MNEIRNAIRGAHKPVGVVAAAEAGEPPDCAVCGVAAWPCASIRAADMLDKLRALVDGGPPSYNSAVWGEWERGYGSALDDVGKILDGKEPAS